MHRLIGALLLLLPLVFCDDVIVKDKIADCPERQVCVLFLQSEQCSTQHGRTDIGYIAAIWEAKTICKYGTYAYMRARIDFEPLSTATWSVLVTTYQNINYISFTFEHAHLKFINDTAATLDWSYAGRNGVEQLLMEKLDLLRASSNFQRYKFNITAKGERLINLLGGLNLTYTYNSYDTTLSDGRFAELLAQNGAETRTSEKPPTPSVRICKVDGLKERCGSGCTLNITESAATCSSKLWLDTGNAFFRHWQHVDNIACIGKKWQWKDDDGKEWAEIGKREVSCSAVALAQATTLLYASICGSVGFILLVGAAVALFLFLRRSRVKKAETTLSKAESSVTLGVPVSLRKAEERSWQWPEQQQEPPSPKNAQAEPAQTDAKSEAPRRSSKRTADTAKTPTARVEKR